MANRHYTVDRDYDITLNFKIKVNHISNYYHLSEEDIKTFLDNLEDDFKSHFLWKIRNEHTLEDVGVDFVTFEVKD
jgi:hypothetical protein